jgi:tetratricopeptide (TPR) repeat protein
MRIAVYTIAKDEAQFVERWYESSKDADCHVILDTGSADETVELARSLGIICEVQAFSPWRFDAARNASLDLVPEDFDFCVALDMDEVLLPGWREAIESVPDFATRPRYKYVWSWGEDGSEGLVYGGDKIHRRKGYRWKHPVHEVIMRSPDETPELQWWPQGLEIHHHPDSSKSRSQYMPLLELAVREDPDDDRNAFYYARELMYAGQNERAAQEFRRHLALPSATWGAERSASARYLAQLEPAERESWLLRAAADAPRHREPWIALAMHYYQSSMWELCYSAAKRALCITERPLEFLNEAESWGALADDLASIAAWNMGLLQQAITHAAKAKELAPGDARIANNLSFYKQVKSQ